MKQTGENGSRKKTNNKWFEIQDSIGYWEDFYRQKIIFQEMVQESSFMFDKDGEFFCLDTGRIITGNNLEFIISILNSKLFFFAIKKFYGGGSLGSSGVRMKHTFFQDFPVPIISAKELDVFVTLVNLALNKKINKDELIHIQNQINELIYKLYNLTNIEIQ